MLPQNNFGHMRSDYASARRGYPSPLYDYLLEKVGFEKPATLDLGCGTGISTRELQQRGFQVQGADKDAEMLAVAREQSPDIAYTQAPADTLPFESDTFDLVTAFSAFHWFNDEASLAEIKRVLKKGGYFFAALKGNRKDEESGEFLRGYAAVLAKYGGEGFDKTPLHFQTQIVESLFCDIQKKSFFVDEKYSIDDALALARSFSMWNLVPEEDKGKFLDELRAFYQEHLIDGWVVRRREIFTLLAQKA